MAGKAVAGPLWPIGSGWQPWSCAVQDHRFPLCQEGPGQWPAGPEPTTASVGAVVRTDMGPDSRLQVAGFQQ